LSSLIFPHAISAIAKLTGKFASLEEPTDDLNIAIVLVLLANGSGFAGSERQTEPKDPTRKLRLPIIRSIS
jgi:hypothetical protein